MSNAISEQPFDQIATDYDREFTETPLARTLRGIVWSRLAANFDAGDRVLELNCGTGEDAVWLARRGVQVVATDISSEMLAMTARKAALHGVTGRIETRMLDLASPRPGVAGAGVDGVLSNFGGLNCVRDLRPLAKMLGEVVKPGGRLIVVPMSRWCAWEIIWHVMHLHLRIAFRRLRENGVEADVCGGKVQVWYPGVRSLRQAFEPDFRLARITGLGVFLPPSYLEPTVARRPRLFRWLVQLERATASVFPFKYWADHLILEFECVTSEK